MDETPKSILRRAGRSDDGEFDLTGTALALAALDRPRVSVDWYHGHLERLSADVAGAMTSARGGAEAAAAALAEVLAGRYGFQGDSATYEDLQNANLMRVIDRRKGLPVALGIIYLHVARAQGWGAVGLSFPGHFLVRLERAGQRVIIDPFNHGEPRGPANLREMLKAMAGNHVELAPRHYAPVADREVVLRLENNIKLRLLRDQQPDRAVEVIERMLLFAPGEPGLLRELGLLQARLGNIGAAIGALERFIAQGGDDRLLHQTAVLLQQLRTRLN